MKKTCTKCHTNQDFTLFSADKTGRLGVRSVCKKCDIQYRYKTFARRKAYQKTYIRSSTGVRNRSAYYAERQRNRRKNPSIKYLLSEALRGRFRRAIKQGLRSGSAVRDLGCTTLELRVHLEKQFQQGMAWENWSYAGWHIDHIKPLSSFNLSDRAQLLKAVHYTNLQPLWAKDNFKKSNKT